MPTGKESLQNSSVHEKIKAVFVEDKYTAVSFNAD